jgi:hypothetical protein
MENPEKKFLSKKYDDFHSSKEVERAVATSDESIEQSKESRIDAYLKRIKDILETERPGGKTGADLLTHKLVEEYILDTSDEDKMQELARDLYESERQIALERGQGDEIVDLENSNTDILEEYRETLEEKRQIQKETLESWTNFLLEGDGQDEPAWFQYFIIRSLRDMGRFDRDNLRYAHRTEKTIAAFPELNEEAVGFVYNALKTQLQIEEAQIPNEIQTNIVMNTELTDDDIARIEDNAPESVWEAAKEAKLKNKRNQKRKEWMDEQRKKKQAEFILDEAGSLDEDREDELSQELLGRLETKDFAKLYAFAQVEIGGVEKLTIEGEWKKYEQGSDPDILQSDLNGKGTGWCTARGSFAADQLTHGDFYVYYTYSSEGDATEPRVAIRQGEAKKVAEVRGIGKEQSLEPDFIDTAQDKYGDMPGAKKYEQASHDMKQMTKIYNKCFRADKETEEKTYLAPELSKQELTFLYEIDRQIESFGNGKDSRIREIHQNRDKHADLSRALNCRPDQISFTKEEFLSRGDILFHYGNLNLQGDNITELPDNLSVGGYLDLRGTDITKLPDNLSVDGWLNLRDTPITELPDNLSVDGYLTLQGTNITELPDNLSVGGYLDLRGTDITKLPDNLSVDGWLNLRDTPITELPDNLSVDGWLDLRGTDITELPDNLSVDRKIYTDF